MSDLKVDAGFANIRGGSVFSFHDKGPCAKLTGAAHKKCEAEQKKKSEKQKGNKQTPPHTHAPGTKPHKH